MLLTLALSCGGAVQTLAASPAVRDFRGHYELAKRAAKAFALDVRQSGGEAAILFSAGHEDGSGAAPDGDGKGRLNAAGALEFQFTDSFNNTGKAVLRRAGKFYRLSMAMDRVTEPRAVVHYGNLTLRRTSTQPQLNDR